MGGKLVDLLERSREPMDALVNNDRQGESHAHQVDVRFTSTIRRRRCSSTRTRSASRRRADFSQGNYRWLTVASAEEPNGVELVLESNSNPAGKAYQEAMRGKRQPAAIFLVEDVQAEHDRLVAKGVKFTKPVTSVTGSIIAILDDSCGNLIQLTKLTWG